MFMGFFYKRQKQPIQDIITNVFRSGDYVVTVHYKKEAGIVPHKKHLAEVIESLEKGYQAKNKGLIFAGTADTQAVRLVVNADVKPVELLEMLWNDMDCLQINLLVTTSWEGILMAAEEMSKGAEYIAVSKIAGKISRMWRENAGEGLKQKNRFMLKNTCASSGGTE